MEAENRDFKYSIQDVSKLYIGARYTYREMLEEEDIPFKFKAVVREYVLREVSEDTTPENHIFFMRDTDLSYMLYKQIKARFKLDFPQRSPDGTWQYRGGYYTIDEIVHNEAWHQKKDEIVVEEMMFTKLHLMLVSL